MLRLITEGKISAEEAVRAYHGILQAKSIKPKLALEKDLELTDQAMSYDGAATARSSVTVRNNPLARSSPATDSRTAAVSGHLTNGAPDFEKMDAAQRRAYDLDRLTRRFG